MPSPSFVPSAVLAQRRVHRIRERERLPVPFRGRRGILAGHKAVVLTASVSS